MYAQLSQQDKRAAHDNRFDGYRKPTEVTIPKYAAITAKTKELADLIYDECPDSLEKSKALTDLQNVRMWANAAIAIHCVEIKEDEIPF